MKTRSFILTAALMLSLMSCNAQKKNDNDTAMNAEQKTEKETPKGNWKVNKQFDENGNLISYDSIYTYGYSTNKNDTIALSQMQDAMKNFQQYFSSTDMPSDFMNGFLSDSLQNGENFFSDDFFKNRMFSEDMQAQIKQMDSLRNSFIKKYQSQLWENKNSATNSGTSSENKSQI